MSHISIPKVNKFILQVASQNTSRSIKKSQLQINKLYTNPITLFLYTRVKKKKIQVGNKMYMVGFTHST